MKYITFILLSQFHFVIMYLTALSSRFFNALHSVWRPLFETSRLNPNTKEHTFISQTVSSNSVTTASINGLGYDIFQIPNFFS